MSYQSKFTGLEIDTILDSVENKQDTLVSGTNIKTINGESIVGSGNIEIGGGASIQSMVATTWSELKELRDNASLVAGTWYRITDYVTTTSQANTISANHPFDVAVLATGENTLSEEARAVRHEGEQVTSLTIEGFPYSFVSRGTLVVDNVEWFKFEAIVDGVSAIGVSSSANPAVGDMLYAYYDGTIDTSQALPIASVYEMEDEYFLNYKANLDAWKIWYCLDNDNVRFPWAYAKTNKQIVVQADPITYAEYNGTFYYEGVIYHRWDARDSSTYVLSLLTTTDNPSVGDPIPFYGIIDLGFIMECSYSIDGIIEASTSEGFGVIYRMIDERGNDCPYDFKNIQFLVPITDGQIDSENGTEEWVFTFNLNLGDGSASTDYSNTSFCSNNLIKFSSLGLNYNIFLNRYANSQCYNNTLEIDCVYNVFNDACYNNTLEPGCSDNVFDANIRNCKVAFGIQSETIPYSSIFDKNVEVLVSYDDNNQLLISVLSRTIDTSMSLYSTNAVQNKVIKSYVDSNCNIPVITTTASSQSLVANTYYKWSNTPTSITITLTTPTNTNILNNYMFEFTASSSGCTLSVPSSIKWLNEIPPVIEPSKTYQISIINNLATVAKFS